MLQLRDPSRPRTLLVAQPRTASITLPEAFTELLRQHEVQSVRGDGRHFMFLADGGTGESLRDIGIELAATEVPDAGPVIVVVSGLPGTATPDLPGIHTLTTGGMIDTFEVNAAVSPVPSTTATFTPVRPVVVQTDFATHEHSTALPLLTGGGLAAATIAAVALGRSARRARRRH